MPDHLVKFLSTTSGRDRLNRFIQYLCKFLIGYGTTRFSKQTITRLTALMTQATATRKLMRVGRQLEFYNLAKNATLLSDDVLRIATVCKNGAFCLWLFHDSISWAHNSGIVNITDVKKIVDRGNKFWLYGLIAAVISDIYKLQWNLSKTKMELKLLRHGQKNRDEIITMEAQKTLNSLADDKKAILYSAIQNSLDIIIPASSIGYVNVDPVIVAFIGTLTSIMGGYTQWKSIKG